MLFPITSNVFKNISGITAQASENIELTMREKYLFICSVSGMGAVTRQPLGGFRFIPESRAILRRALEEVARVANVRGIDLNENSVQSVMDRIDQIQPDVMASMQKDIISTSRKTSVVATSVAFLAERLKSLLRFRDLLIIEDRPSELESQTCTLVRMVRAADVSVPTHEFIYASLLPMEKKAREKL